MRTLEVTEAGGIREGKDLHPFGALVSLDDKTARRWLKAGWARDPETGEQHERDLSPKSLHVHSQ